MSINSKSSISQSKSSLLQTLSLSAAPMIAIAGQTLAQSGGSRTNVQPVQTPEPIEQMIDQLMGESCPERGVVFVDVSEITSTFEIELRGLGGNAYVTVSAGMTSAQLAEAINNYVTWTDVEAIVAQENPVRVAVRTRVPGQGRFVRVRQLGDDAPIVFAVGVGGTPLHDRTDYGCTFGVPACAESARLYLDTGQNLNHRGEPIGSVTVFIASGSGWHPLSFTSGTSQPDIIDAINSLESALGVTAETCSQNRNLVAVRSQLVGSLAFVRIQQVGGAPPIVALDPVDVTHAYDLIGNGQSGVAADVNCDRLVGIADLLGTVQHWGPCPHTQPSCAPDVTGDGVVNTNDLWRVISNWGATD